MLDVTKLHDYQLRGRDHLLEHDHAGLFFDMGLGKTATTLTALDELIFDILAVNNALVIGPKRVAENVWGDEIKEWAHLNKLSISIISGSEKQRNAALKEKARVYTIGRDNVSWLCSKFGGSNLPFDMLIVDESSSFKNSNSKRFKALRRVVPGFKRVTILTGTPAPNGLIDLWSQIYLLDRGERLGKTLTEYREKYFKPNQRNGSTIYNYKLKKGAEKEIYAKISDICISMKAEDYLRLPPCLIQDVPIYFDKALQQKYDEFEEEQVLELLADNGDITQIAVLHAAALSNKLLQFANGAVYDENKEFHEVHDLKLETCKELIEAANGEPVLIAWTYRHDMIRLKKYLKSYVVRELQTSQDIQDWNEGKIEVLLMHPASGGHGLNLQKGGNIIIWFGQTFNLEWYLQLNKRLNRQGQTRPGRIYRLKAVNTMDIDALASLEAKNGMQNGLLDAVKARFLKYKRS